MEQNKDYKKGFIPYALAAFLIGIVGGFSTVLGPSFVQDNAVRSLLWAEFWLDIQGIPWRTDRCHHQLGRLNYGRKKSGAAHPARQFYEAWSLYP